MKQGRLIALMAIALALGILRWQFPPRQDDAATPVAAFERSRPASPVAPDPGSPAPAASSVALEDSAARGAGNAFSVRIPQPPEPATLRPLPVVRPQVAAPVPPPPVPSAPPPLIPPFQVVGTWDDGANPGVFLVGTSDIVLAHQGSVLADYRVIGITRDQLSLLHLPSNQTLQLNIPQAVPR